MKGFVFTEFLGFVEEALGEDMVDDLIDATDLESGGAYTAVGNYPATEIFALVTTLTRLTGQQVPELLNAFGHHLIGRLRRPFASMFDIGGGVISFLEGIEDKIHFEVRKLYPDAELPTFRIIERSDDSIVMEYRSCRPLAHLALGMIRGASEIFEEPLSIAHTTGADDQGTFVTFTITRCEAAHDDPSRSAA